MRLPLTALLTCCLAAPTFAAAPDCTSEPSSIALDRIDARAIVIGERHGTEQAPALTGQLVCGLLKRGRSTILALERDSAEQPALDRYLRSPGGPEDVQTLLANGAWASQLQDGRNSQAMLKLIEQMRQWRAAGQRVGVLAMQSEGHDIAPLSDDEKRPITGADLDRFSAINDRSMADKVWMTLALHPGYTVVALAGNVHTAVASKTRARSLASPSFADVLASYIPIHVIGLKASDGGSAWNLSSQGSGAHPVSAGSAFYMNDARVDSLVDLGRVSASAPAAQRQAAAQ